MSHCLFRGYFRGWGEVALCVLFVLPSGNAQAGVWGFPAGSLGGIFAGPTDGSVSSVFWNPAAIDEAKGYTVGGDIAPTLAYINVGLEGQSRVSSTEWGLPFLAGGIAAPWEKFPLALGFAAYSPFGTSAEFPADGPQRFHLVRTEVSTLYLTPAFSVAPISSLSIGGGLSIIREVATLRMAQDVVLDEVNADLSSFSGWSWGWTVGLHFKPRERIAVGAAYLSPADFAVKGTAHFSMASAPGQRSSNPGRILTSLPGALHAGVSYIVSDRWTIGGLVRREMWSMVRNLIMEVDTADDTLRVKDEARSLQDTVSGRITGRYYGFKDLILAGGLGFQQKGTLDSHVSAGNLDFDMLQVEAGASMGLGRGFSGALTLSGYVPFARRITGSGVIPSANGRYTGAIGQVHVSLLYSWEKGDQGGNDLAAKPMDLEKR